MNNIIEAVYENGVFKPLGEVRVKEHEKVTLKEEVADLMGTTKSVVSRLEATGKHAPSLTTLEKYAQAVGCSLEIKLVPKVRQDKKPIGLGKKQATG